MKKKNKKEISDYDHFDTTSFIDKANPLKLKALGYELLDEPPTKVVSIRLPTKLLNALKALGAKMDVPYQSLIKTYLWDRAVKKGHA